MRVLFKYYYGYLSTQVLSFSLSIKLDNCYRVWVLYQIFRGVTQGTCTLCPHKSMQPEHKSQNYHTVWVLYLNLWNHYVDTIFVLSDLGTDQGMST